MAPLGSYQPFKGILTALVLIVSPLYFASLALCYFPKRLRPHPKWTFQTSMARALYLMAFKFSAMIHLRPDYILTAGAAKERFVLVQPASSDLYTGVLSHPKIKPVPFGALWFPHAPTAADIESRKFVLHLPGGAYVIAPTTSKTGVFTGDVYSSTINAIVFYAQYRVAAEPVTRFPAAIQDAVTFYSYLLELGIPAKNIIISGDSAGGNLVIALVRYIEDNNKLLPRPLGAISWSPWVDITSSAVARYKKSKNNSTDFVPWTILAWGLEAYPPPSEESSDIVQRYVSPARHPFFTGIPLLVQVGTAEVFHDDVRTFAQEMVDIEGNRVKYHETPYTPHDLILCGELLGLRRETEEVVQAANQYFMQ